MAVGGELAGRAKVAGLLPLRQLGPVDVPWAMGGRKRSIASGSSGPDRWHCHVRCVSVTWEDRSGEYRNAVVQGPSVSG